MSGTVKQKPLGKYGDRVLAKIRNGATLCCEVVHHEGATAEEGRRWFLEPGGKSVGPVTARRLISRKLVEPNVAGLFHRNDAQTYRAVQP